MARFAVLSPLCACFQVVAQRLQLLALHRIRKQLPPLSLLQFTCLLRGLPDIPLAMPLSGVRADKISIVVHVHYADLWAEIAARLQSLSIQFDLIVTATSDAVLESIQVHRQFPQATTIVMENRGRDVLPFLRLLTGGQLTEYDLVCKLHTKKSPHRRNGTSWRNAALDALVSNAGNCVQRFRADPALGLLGPAAYRFYQGRRLGSNSPWLLWLIARFGIGRVAAGTDFFAGTMFWARVAALAPLTSAADIIDKAEAEAAQIDGTLAHAVERVLPMIVRQGGYRIDGVTRS